MIIIYYKDKKTGKIGNAHTPHPDLPQTLEGLEPAVAEYNSKDHMAEAAVVEVADDSLEAYLFNRMNKRANLDKQAVRDAIAAIQDALDCARYLED